MAMPVDQLFARARTAAHRGDAVTASEALAEVLARFPANRRAQADLAALFGIAPPPAPVPAEAFALLERLWAAGDYALLAYQIRLLRLLWPAEAALAAAEGEALLALGRAQIEAGDADVAIATLRRATVADGNNGAIANALAVALFRAGAFVEAEDAARRAIALDPADAAAYANRAGALRELDRLGESRAAWDAALALVPDAPGFLDGLATTLLCDGQAVAAVETARRAIAAAPDMPEFHNHLGAALQELGQLDEARAAYTQALALRPAFPSALFNLGTLDLLEGRFDTGWARHEWRQENLGPHGPRTPAWRPGADLAGQRIRLDFEQGLGDTLQFIRYAPRLAARGAIVTAVVQPPLLPLLAGAFPGVTVVGADAAAGPFDAQASLLSLPFLFADRDDALAADGPYLRAREDRVAAWRERLAPTPFRIGICWQGSTGRIDLGRSFPLAAAAPLARLTGVRLVSLHKGAGVGQLADLPEGMGVEVPSEPFDAAGEAFLDSAAVMALCDLVVTSDTSVAHLAGALGVPTWLMARKVPDWRWGIEGEDCPWYPAMRLLRQDTAGDWHGLFAHAAQRLQALLDAGQRP